MAKSTNRKKIKTATCSRAFEHCSIVSKTIRSSFAITSNLIGRIIRTRRSVVKSMSDFPAAIDFIEAAKPFKNKESFQLQRTNASKIEHIKAFSV